MQRRMLKGWANVSNLKILGAGLIRVPGLMPPRCKMFDTPGVPHAFQLSSRLGPEEVVFIINAAISWIEAGHCMHL